MKSPWVLLAVTAISVSGFASQVFAQTRNEAPLPTHQQLSRLGLERAWWAQAVLNPHRDKVRTITIDEDAIVVQSTSGIVTALDAETGQQLWANLIPAKDQQSYPAITSESLVMVIYGDTMYAYHKRTGRTMWTFDLPYQPSSGPAIDDRQIYFGCLDGSLYAFNLKKIRQLYEERRLPKWSADAMVWKYKTAKEITSPPITSNGTVNVASRDGSLYSLKAKDRKVLYQLETDRPIVAPLSRIEDMIFMASEDHSFYAINLQKGKVIWEFTSGLPIRKAPWSVEQDLYLYPDRGGMYSLDPANGENRWWQPSLTDYVSILGNRVIASDRDGNLVLVSRDKGEIVGQLPFRRYSVRPGNDRTDRIYLSTESGLVVCLRQIGHNFPRYLRYPDRLPLIPLMESEDGSESKPEMESSEK